ncbi:MAG: type II secretion system GspH family protein [Lachnospiraceae bacterium]|nr:type II secretion system GspH family protein [Lachnospiraceae bacterium]
MIRAFDFGQTRKKADNRGFSLVELIIVIAIMAVLVGVLAPQFMKYVENSRRARDIQDANAIRDAVLAALANGDLSGGETAGGAVDFDSINTFVRDLTVSRRADSAKFKDRKFMVYYRPDGTDIEVRVAGYVLTTDAGAQAYRDATAPVPTYETDPDDAAVSNP